MAPGDRQRGRHQTQQKRDAPDTRDRCGLQQHLGIPLRIRDTSKRSVGRRDRGEEFCGHHESRIRHNRYDGGPRAASPSARPPNRPSRTAPMRTATNESARCCSIVWSSNTASAGSSVRSSRRAGSPVRASRTPARLLQVTSSTHPTAPMRSAPKPAAYPRISRLRRVAGTTVSGLG